MPTVWVGEPGRVSRVGLGGLFGGSSLFERDGEARGVELPLEAAGSVFDGVVRAPPVGSELAVGNLVLVDVVVPSSSAVGSGLIAIVGVRRVSNRVLKWLAAVAALVVSDREGGELEAGEE